MFSALTSASSHGHYRIVLYCGEADPGDQPRPTRWAILGAAEERPLLEGCAATPRAAEDAALRAFADMLGT